MDQIGPTLAASVKITPLLILSAAIAAFLRPLSATVSININVVNYGGVIGNQSYLIAAIVNSDLNMSKVVEFSEPFFKCLNKITWSNHTPSLWN